MQVTVLKGSTFCVSDERGDVDGASTGLFASDTRFLSRCVLTVNGERPLLLSNGQPSSFSAAFFLRNPLGAGLPADAISIRRERFVGDSMREEIAVRNHARDAVDLEIALELAADFADIFDVKRAEFTGEPPRADGRPPARDDGGPMRLVFADDTDPAGRTDVVLSQPGELDGGTVRYRVSLPAASSWTMHLDVQPSFAGERDARDPDVRHAEERVQAESSLASWRQRTPRLDAGWLDLECAFAQSTVDLAVLRMDGAFGDVPAAGLPWFMTVFGRDTIITCLQSLLLGPELSRSALRLLASLQATEDDPRIDAEPGKIIHELRRGKAARSWFGRYYGAVDTTPLYLVLLSELWRWTGDDAIVAELEQPARRALEWIDRYGDLDGDGFVEYLRRAPGGILNQSWKDSGDSMVFADGSRAEPPIAPVEVQGYVYDAKLRTAELARRVWGDEATAARLEREAADLRAAFDSAFWCGSHYGLGLDRDKRCIDGVASNMGHLLWSGIVPPERVAETAGCLAGDSLWSGWGIRTLGARETAYNPIGYHNGTVWPHENSLIALGLARAGRHEEAAMVVRAVVDASARFGYRLPEVFAGFGRDETPFPVEYPTASRPQAWAAAAPVLLLQVLLGLRPDRERRVLEARTTPLPAWAGEVRLEGARAFDARWDVVADGDGHVRVQRA